MMAVAILALSACGGRGKVAKPETRYGVEVVRCLPHDVKAYTQGLFFHGGRLFETTGQYGESTLRVYPEPGSRKPDREISFDRKYFLEGSVVFKDKIYILTWREGVVFVYDAATFKFQKSIPYTRQGWGLTTDGEQLIATDGSSNLYFLDEELCLLQKKTVRRNGRPVPYLNELEYIDGKIWANVYTSDEIIIIDPKTAQVEASVDCTGLLGEMYRTPETDVLNGIARNPSDGKIYLTGKNWPFLFEVKLVSRARN